MKQYRSLFRNRNFLLLWGAAGISNIGDFFNSVALVKVLSEDPAHLGLWMALVMIAKVVPSVILGPVAGVVADRFSRKTIMVIADLTRAVLVLGLVFVQTPAAIITLCFLSAAVAAFFNPASSAVLPNVVTKEELVSAGSLQYMTGRLAQLLGNGIGAVFLGLMGPHNVFYIDAASFVLSTLLILGLALPATAARAAEPKTGVLSKVKGDLLEAWQFVRNTATMRNLMIVLGIVAIGDSALNVLLVTYFTQDLGIPAENLGYIMAMFGGVSVLGALLVGAVGSKVDWRHLLTFGGFYAWAVLMGALLFNQITISTIFFLLLGVGSGCLNVAIQAAVGTLVPDHVRGRVFASWGMVNSLIYVAGTMTAGPLADVMGSGKVLLIFTTTYLIATVFAFVAFRPSTAPAESSAQAAVGTGA